MSHDQLNSKKSWIVYTVALLAYLSAVAQRTSFGVAGLEATERFNASASILATFSVVQLLVYAAGQVPVGLILDKVGPRRMIVGGAILMTLGQAFLAFANNVPQGLVGRVLVGAGDAMVFVSVLRLLPMWFSGSRIPMLTQITGTVGQLGQLISLFPFHAMLIHVGWTPAFAMLAVIAFVSLLLVITFVHNGHEWRGTGEEDPLSTRARLAAAWRQPGTRLGFWTHFSTAFMVNVFMLTWGFPFLVEGQGVSGALASSLLSIFVVVAIVLAPILGALTARYPTRRSLIALTIVLGMTVMWAVVLLWPGRAPLWVLIVLMISIAAGGPASVIGFDFARTFNPPHVMGTATGLVNVGGFSGAFICMYLIGMLLDFQFQLAGGERELYNLGAFKLALCVQFVFVAVGISGMLLARKKARRQQNPGH